MIDTPTYLYRLYDEDGELLYVGITRWVDGRMEQHARNKSWWPDVATRKVERFSSRREAAAAERDAIRSEGPKYNIDGVVPRTRPIRKQGYVIIDSRRRTSLSRFGVKPGVYQAIVWDEGHAVLIPVEQAG